jgi:cytochrome c
MFRNILKIFSVVAVVVALQAQASDEGKELFLQKCNMCHKTSRPSDMSKLIAPPIMGVMRHVKMNYPTKEEAIAFITDYVLNPQRDKAVCMTDKIKKFGLMPSQKGLVTKEQIRKIASYLYDNYPPKGFRGMHEMQEKK